uniref:Uncharacterized protein n=1 Tax=Pyxicephalus adspersus TaxID=30357 RepID=A0AAV2ZQW9_PYXAD|nr:TPA: hypothetical protein GDO54_014886 [Pyxicephalus adspersus]
MACQVMRLLVGHQNSHPCVCTPSSDCTPLRQCSVRGNTQVGLKVQHLSSSPADFDSDWGLEHTYALAKSARDHGRCCFLKISISWQI